MASLTQGMGKVVGEVEPGLHQINSSTFRKMNPAGYLRTAGTLKIDLMGIQVLILAIESLARSAKLHRFLSLRL